MCGSLNCPHQDQTTGDCMITDGNYPCDEEERRDNADSEEDINKLKETLNEKDRYSN